MSSRSSCESVTTTVRSSISRSATSSGQALIDLVRARDALGRRERGARVDDGRAPAELLAVGAEVLGGLGRAEDHDAERALDHLGEDAVVAETGALEDAALEPLLAGVRVGVEHPVAVGVEQRANVAPELGIGLLDPDVDLAAAGEPDLPGLAVGDAVVDAAGDLAGEDVLRPLDDVGLDAAAGDRADEACRSRATIIFAPGWRGADRIVSITVATTTRSPAARRLVDHVEDVVHGSSDSAEACSGGPICPPRRRPAGGADARARTPRTAVAAPAITSPVERISGPRVAAPGNRSAGNTASFAQARVGTARSGRPSAGERLAEQQPHRVLDERHAGRLGDERHRPRRARVRLEHVELPAGERELKVDQAARAEAARRSASRPRGSRPRAPRETDGPGSTQAESPEWTPVGSTCSSTAATQRVLAVAERVDVELERAFEVAVDEARPLDAELVGGVRDVHAAAADHVVRPDEHGVADPLRELARLLGVLGHAPLRREVAGELARSGRDPRRRRSRRAGRRAAARPPRRARARGAAASARRTRPRRRTAARARRRRARCAAIERLEVEAVGGVVVGRDRLGVRVHEHRLVAELPQRLRRVDAAVVELDRLPDPVRARRRARSPRGPTAPGPRPRPRA